MNIDDLMAEIATDVGVPLRRDMIDWEAGRNQQLHHKYRTILYFERLDLKKMELNIVPLLRAKREYYCGKAPEEVYKTNPFPIRLQTLGNRVVKEDLAMYVESDPDVIAARLLIASQVEKVELLKDTLDEIRKRSFSISNVITYAKFKHGLDNLNQVFEFADPDAGMDD